MENTRPLVEWFNPKTLSYKQVADNTRNLAVMPTSSRPSSFDQMHTYSYDLLGRGGTHRHRGNCGNNPTREEGRNVCLEENFDQFGIEPTQKIESASNEWVNACSTMIVIANEPSTFYICRGHDKVHQPNVNCFHGRSRTTPSVFWRCLAFRLLHRCQWVP